MNSDKELAEIINRFVGMAVLKNDKNYSWDIIKAIKDRDTKRDAYVIGNDRMNTAYGDDPEWEMKAGFVIGVNIEKEAQRRRAKEWGSALKEVKK